MRISTQQNKPYIATTQNECNGQNHSAPTDIRDSGEKLKLNCIPHSTSYTASNFSLFSLKLVLSPL